MRRIDRVAGSAMPGSGRAKAAAGEGGFNVEPGSVPAEGAGRSQEVQPAGLTGMLALQEAEAEVAGKRNGRRHGLALLDALQDLQRDLLAPVDDQAQISGLARLAEAIPAVTDPGLADVLAAIRLRAKIELLRRGLEPG